LAKRTTTFCSYDATSNRVSLTDPAGSVSTYSYDSLNRLTGLANSKSGNFGFGYDALGRRTSLTRPNGVDTSYTYDNLSRLLGVLHNGGSLPGSAGYTYDAAGNRTSETALQQADPNPVSVLSQYTYDDIYQLTQAVVGGNLAESYTYDGVGIRLTSVDPASYTYDESNHLTATSAELFRSERNYSAAFRPCMSGQMSRSEHHVKNRGVRQTPPNSALPARGFRSDRRSGLEPTAQRPRDFHLAGGRGNSPARRGTFQQRDWKQSGNH